MVRFPCQGLPLLPLSPTNVKKKFPPAPTPPENLPAGLARHKRHQQQPPQTRIRTACRRSFFLLALPPPPSCPLPKFENREPRFNQSRSEKGLHGVIETGQTKWKNNQQPWPSTEKKTRWWWGRRGVEGRM